MALMRPDMSPVFCSQAMKAKNAAAWWESFTDTSEEILRQGLSKELRRRQCLGTQIVASLETAV